MSSFFRIGSFAFALALALAPARSAAQRGATGTLEGRVLNPATGEFLEFARITIEEAGLETFTDSTGEYRLTNVPAGAATVKAFRTGMAVQTATVPVVAGQ